MSSPACAAVRHASRLCKRRASATYAQSQFRPATRLSSVTCQRRCYVSESKPQHARVSDVESAIKADQKKFIQQSGSLPSQTSLESGLSGDTAMSPAAGILKQATVMDQGTRPIYLDAQATTPVDPRVLDAMLPYLTGMYGNPHSRTHAYGWESEKAADQAREHVAKLIGADPKEI